jgi:VRR-NUC domain
MLILKVKKMKHQESIEQQALIKWADLYYVESIKSTLKKHLFAVPNGGKRNLIEAARLKKEGVRSGVPDIFLALPNTQSHGLFIELKSKTGRLTKEQKDYLELLQKSGYCAQVCFGWEQAKAVIIDYLRC